MQICLKYLQGLLKCDRCEDDHMWGNDNGKTAGMLGRIERWGIALCLATEMIIHIFYVKLLQCVFST